MLFIILSILEREMDELNFGTLIKFSRNETSYWLKLDTTYHYTVIYQ